MGGPAVTLLGPRHRSPDDQAAISDWAPGPLAAVASDVDRWAASFARPIIDLDLGRRWLSVLESDRELAQADRDLQTGLADEQLVYVIRLRHASATLSELIRSPAAIRRRETELADVVADVGRLDRRHLEVVSGMRTDFLERLAGRSDLDHHRHEIADLLGLAAGLIVAGGHVGRLLHLLMIFELRAMITGPVVTWSAGAMALGSKVLLFHDHHVAGAQPPQFLCDGLGLLPDVVVLPDAQRRLDLHDRQRARWLTTRLLPQRGVFLDGRDRVDFEVDHDAA